MSIISYSILIDAITILLITIVIGGYLYVTKIYKYWKIRGVKSIEPKFPFGNTRKNFLQQQSFSQTIQELYKKYPTDRFFGIFIGLKPNLIVRDPQLIRSIFIKDFQYFHDRGTFIDEKTDPLSGHLFSLTGEKWRNLRTKLSPVFTSGKLKAMFQTIVDCGEPLTRYMNRIAKNQDTIEIHEICARYTTNVIASTAFGINCNCIDDPDTDFRKFGREAFRRSKLSILKIFIIRGLPSLRKWIKIRLTPKHVEKFMMSVVRDTLNYRETNNIVRKDFFQLLMQLRNTGQINDNDEKWEPTICANSDSNDNRSENKKITFNEMAAQAWVFYLAGFETSSTVMSFCLFELAKNPDCQRRVHQEIDEILEKYNGKITYDSVGEMKYLENCIDETLRKYPPLGVLQRICTKDYRIPETDIMLEKGTIVNIPALALQYDEKYYPEPDVFNPDRFKVENRRQFIEQPYMPFGEGPRICIGLRMGKIQTQVGLIIMLHKFNYQLSGNTLNELIFDTRSFIVKVNGGLHLKVTERDLVNS